jgi:PadR family transcriptional regulator, regulatory protein PadR
MSRSEVREPSFLVLAALAEGQQHGYALMQRIQVLHDVGIRPGTLYAALDRLTAEELVAVTGEEVVEGRPRRYYDLTEAGLQLLDEETRRLQARIRLAQRGLASRRRLQAFGGTA